MVCFALQRISGQNEQYFGLLGVFDKGDVESSRALGELDQGQVSQQLGKKDRCVGVVLGDLYLPDKTHFAITFNLQKKLQSDIFCVMCLLGKSPRCCFCTQCHLDQTPRRISVFFMMAAASASPEWEENLRKLDELCTLRKVEMLKEACEMLTSHAQQLETMAKDSHRSILNIFSIFAQSRREDATMGNWRDQFSFCLGLAC